VPVVHKTGAKNRKYGRNANFCQRYSIENRRMRNKIKKLKRHIRFNANEIKRKARRDPPRHVKIDQAAITALKILTGTT
jgi:hypothetical protein